MTLCAIGRFQQGAMLACDSLSSEENGWTCDIADRKETKWISTCVNKGTSVGLVGAGDGQLVARVMKTPKAADIADVAHVANRISRCALDIMSQTLVELKTAFRKEIIRYKGGSRDDATDSAARELVDHVARPILASSEFLLVSVCQAVDIHRITSCGTLIRAERSPICVVGNGALAYSEWRRTICSPMEGQPTPENVLLDLLCIMSLGCHVLGVGGTPSYSAVLPSETWSCDPHSAVLMTNAAGLYLAGVVGRSHMERLAGHLLIHHVVDDATLTRLVPGLSPLQSAVIGMKACPYSFWQTQRPPNRRAVASVGPYEVFAEGLSRRTVVADAPADESPFAYFDRREEVANTVKPNRPNMDSLQALVMEPGEEIAEEDLLRVCLWQYVSERGSLPAMSDSSWLIEPFGRLTVFPLISHLSDVFQRTHRLTSENRLVSFFWATMVQQHWRKCLMSAWPNPRVERIGAMVYMMFTWLHQSLPEQTAMARGYLLKESDDAD